MLATLLKRSKHTYFSSFFQNHINDLKNTWKSITRIISWKDSLSTVPTTIIEDDISLTNPKNIAAGIQFFKNILEINSLISFIKLTQTFFSLTHLVKQMENILSLDLLKPIGPNSIPNLEATE